jgi:hypothetical protein
MLVRDAKQWLVDRAAGKRSNELCLSFPQLPDHATANIFPHAASVHGSVLSATMPVPGCGFVQFETLASHNTALARGIHIVAVDLEDPPFHAFGYQADTVDQGKDHQPTGLENGQAVNHLHAPTAVVHALSALGAVTVGPEAGAAPGAQVGAQACLHTGGAATDAAGARAGGAPIGVNLTTILGAQLAVAASVSYVRTFPSGAVLPTHVKTRSTLSTARLPANLS